MEGSSTYDVLSVIQLGRRDLTKKQMTVVAQSVTVTLATVTEYRAIWLQ